jgi:hypothetical protein
MQSSGEPMTYAETLTAQHRTCDGDLVRAEQTD